MFSNKTFQKTNDISLVHWVRWRMKKVSGEYVGQIQKSPGWQKQVNTGYCYMKANQIYVKKGFASNLLFIWEIFIQMQMFVWSKSNETFGTGTPLHHKEQKQYKSVAEKIISRKTNDENSNRVRGVVLTRPWTYWTTEWIDMEMRARKIIKIMEISNMLKANTRINCWTYKISIINVVVIIVSIIIISYSVLQMAWKGNTKSMSCLYSTENNMAGNEMNKNVNHYSPSAERGEYYRYINFTYPTTWTKGVEFDIHYTRMLICLIIFFIYTIKYIFRF